MNLKQGAGAFLLLDNGLVAMQLKDNLDFLSDKWCVSAFGGGFEEGEDELSCLKRELLEELELEITELHRIVKVGEYIVDISNTEKVLVHQFIVTNINLSIIKPREGNICIIDPETDQKNLKFGFIASHYAADSIDLCKKLLSKSN